MKKILEKIEVTTAAELTNRLRAEDPGFRYPEWLEYGTLEGVPVVIQYFTTPEDQGIADETGDWGNADWENALTDIWINACECDRKEISDRKINQVVEKYNLKIK